MPERTEVCVIALSFSWNEHGEQRVMKIVTPLRVEAKASGFAWRYDTWIIQIAFGDEREAARSRRLQRFNLCGKLLKKVDRRPVDKSVYRIDAQPVDMKI